MNLQKKFVPCIYLKNGEATRSLTDSAVVSPDPVELAMKYDNGLSDGLLVFDQSIDDIEHEQSIGIIRKICESVGIPVIGAGHINRMEDVKKLLYAGCAMAALNFSRKDNIALTKEVCDKFGKERIAACYRAVDDIYDNRDLILNCIQELILLDETEIQEALRIEEVPSILSLPEVSLDKVLEFFDCPNVSGISGNAVNDNVDELMDLKKLCFENGFNVRIFRAAFSWDDFRKNSDGLLPVVTQEASTGEVLMVAYMNEEAYNKTVRTGKMTYYSRSRRTLWVKGETSGHFQFVKSLYGDCDMDTLLAKVDQVGPACHTGHHSCFFQTDLVLDDSEQHDPQKVLENDYETIINRRNNPKEGSYTNYLFKKGLDKMLKKLGEENTEIVIAAKNKDPKEIIYEIADYMYHLMVIMAEKGIKWSDVTDELVRRQKKED